MGGNSSIYTTNKTDRDAIQLAHNKAVDQSLYEDGHSYSGEIGMFGYDIRFLTSKPPFKDYDEAQSWLLDNHDKGDNAMGIKFMENGKEMWMIGGWVSS